MWECHKKSHITQWLLFFHISLKITWWFIKPKAHKKLIIQVGLHRLRLHFPKNFCSNSSGCDKKSKIKNLSKLSLETEDRKCMCKMVIICGIWNSHEKSNANKGSFVHVGEYTTLCIIASMCFDFLEDIKQVAQT